MHARVRADGSFALAEEEEAEELDDDGAEEPTTQQGGAAGEGAGGDAGSQHLAGGTTAAPKPPKQRSGPMRSDAFRRPQRVHCRPWQRQQTIKLQYRKQAASHY